MKISKAVKDSDIVALSGDKYIRCGRRNKPVGVYQASNTLTIHTLDDEIETIFIPDGIPIR